MFKNPNGLLAETSWIKVMLGQGIHPEQYHRVMDVMSDEELTRFLGNISAHVERTMASLPSHQDYLDQYGNASRHRVA